MSYEGYYQAVCEKGHRFDMDVYHEARCECGAKAAFVNSVDDTNCDSYGIVRPEGWEHFLIEAERTETCSCCNHTKVVALARYRIPTESEINGFRQRKEVLDSGAWVWINLG